MGERVRTCGLVLAAAILALAPPLRVKAEVLPESGTFEGVYHRDRWGDATLTFFRIPVSLQERMAPFEGRHVRMEVLKGKQRNPGSVIVEEIGKVTPVPAGPLEVALDLVPPDPAAGEPFQAICRITNRGDERVDWTERGTGDVRLAWMVETGAGTAHPSFDRGVQAVPFASAGATLGVGPVALGPGESFPYPVVFEKGLPAGRAELTAMTRRAPDDGKLEYSFAVRTLDLSAVRRERAPPSLRGERTYLGRTKDGGFDIGVRILPGTGDAPSLASCGIPATFAGRVRGFARDGTPVPLEVVRDGIRDGWWGLASLPEGGREFRLRVRHATPFPGKALDRLTMEVLGSGGLTVVTPDLEIRESPEPVQVPFGPAVQGVRLRARAAVPEFEKDGEWSFHLEARNEGGRPVAWWQPHPADFRSWLVILEVDGKEVRPPTGGSDSLFIEGWMTERFCRDPRSFTVRFPAPWSQEPGDHVLRICIRSDGGTVTNSYGGKVPLLEGTLRSNDIPIRVR